MHYLIRYDSNINCAFVCLFSWCGDQLKLYFHCQEKESLVYGSGKNDLLWKKWFMKNSQADHDEWSKMVSSPIGRFQHEKMSTTPIGSGTTRALHGNEISGTSACTHKTPNYPVRVRNKWINVPALILQKLILHLLETIHLFSVFLP